MKVILFSCIFVIIQLANAISQDTLIPCDHDTDCEFMGAVKGDSCRNRFCVCKSENGGLRNCSANELIAKSPPNKVFLVGRVCKHDHDCPGDYSFCNTHSQQCNCREGYVESSDRHRCLKKRQAIGDDCTDDKQCLAFMANTACLNQSTCDCAPSFHYRNNACRKNVVFGEPCKETSECSWTENAVCLSTEHCGCDTNFIIHNANDQIRCIPVAQKMLDECTESSQCTSFYKEAACINNRCQCSNQSLHYDFSAANCVVTKTIDQQCTNSYDCYQTLDVDGVNRLECRGGICVCAEGYERSGSICKSNGASTLVNSVAIILILILITLKLQ